ncbi:RloB family protein [Runella sp.]|jgi:hypothetical protein|uniref:RloB family protein n=1 Tax=Runella sp. TaxID=1960881 RepID=UPI00263856B2|nr:RloB family protein [Runella sp.]
MAEIQPYIRLACEGGKTEPNYFNGYLRSKGFKQPNMAFKPKDHSPIGVARAAKEEYQKAIRLKIPKDKIFVWAIFDRDGHAGVENAIEMLRTTAISTAFSNICFEYWILLHFERTSRSFSNCDELVRDIKENHDSDYDKANNHFDRLKDRVPNAISNATWLKNAIWREEERPVWQLNPYTDVHHIFNSLLEKGFINDI